MQARQKCTPILLSAALVTVVLLGMTSRSWTQGPEQPSASSYLLSKGTVRLLEEAFDVSDIASRFLSQSDQHYISPDLPVPGDVQQDRREAAQPGEGDAILTVSQTSAFHGGTYSAITWYDLYLSCIGAVVYSDRESPGKDGESPGKLIAVVPSHAITGSLPRTTYELGKSYIASEGEVRVGDSSGKAIKVYGQKSSQQEECAVSVPEATLGPGIYGALNGPESALILDQDGGLIATLIGNGDDCHLYIAVQGEVTGRLIGKLREVKLPDGGTARLPLTSLGPGTYRAFNGLYGAFILGDTGRALAVLIKGNGGFELYLACTAQVTGDPVLRTGAYAAFIGPDSAILLADDTVLVTVVEEGHSAVVPSELSLFHNFPNPFNPSTEICFSVPKRSRVTIGVYNVLGELVRELVAAEYSAGLHRVGWDGRDSGGRAVSSGLYFYRLEAGGFDQTRRMVLLR